MIYIGNKEISKLYLGGKAVASAWIGEKKVYPSGSPILDGVIVGTATGNTVEFHFGAYAFTCPVTDGKWALKSMDKTITSMGSAFASQRGITTIDKFAIDTSNVTAMNGVFAGCKSLKSVDLSNFNTSKANNMYYMFESCSNLSTIDLSSFNTSSVTNMSMMFYDCGVKELNFSSFDMSKVTLAFNMFGCCHYLEKITFPSNFITSKVSDLNQMFRYCNSLVTLNLSDWDTSSVTDMSMMFNGCYKLVTLDLSNWNTSKVTTMSNMFYGCRVLNKLDLSSFDTTSISKGWNYAFSDCGVSQLILSSKFFRSTSLSTYDFSGLYKWTDTDSLATFVDALPQLDGTTKTVKLSTETKNALTDNQKTTISNKGWTIA